MLLAVGVACGPTAIALHQWPAATAYVATPRFCLDCHADSGNDLGGHATVRCRSCHAVPAGETLAQVLATVGGSMPEHGALLAASCADCHSGHLGRWTMLMQTEGHASHVEDPVSIECVRCHSSSLHGRPPEEEARCEACHEPPTAGGEEGGLECGTCHAFGGADRVRPAGAWGADLTAADVHGAADCRLCHDPHGGDGPRGAECRTCHRGALARSSAAAPEGHRDCAACHRMHGPREQVAAACGVCHRAPRVRGDHRDPGVPPERWDLASVVPVLEAATAPSPPPDVAHDARCATCHPPHGWAPPEPAACVGCHEEQAAPPSDPPPTAHGCLDCHEPHSRTADPCTSCHDRYAGDVSDGHPECATCHDPHPAAPISGASCTDGCHDGPREQLERGPPEHAACASCHASHAAAGAQPRCVGCHREEFRQFPPSGRVSCGHCHPAHGFAADRGSEPVHGAR